MTTENEEFNPYKFEDLEEFERLPALLEVNRKPLGAFEFGCIDFVVDSDAIKVSNASKAIVYPQITTAIVTPKVVFRNLRRQGFEDALAYSSKIQSTGFVFLTYCRFDHKNKLWLVFDWEPRAECSDKAGRPIGWEDDFVEVVWSC